MQSAQGGQSASNAGSANSNSRGGSTSGGAASSNGGGSSLGGDASGGASDPSTAGGNSSAGGMSAATGGTNAANGGTQASGGRSSATGGKAATGGASWQNVAGANGAGSTCGNSTLDGDETDVDCGGSCAPLARCGAGMACKIGRDCTTSSCRASVCEAPIVIVKNAGCVGASATCPATASTLQAKVQVLNVGTAALSLKGMEVRYYYTDEASTSGTPTVEVYDKSIDTFTIALKAMTTPVSKADHYVSIAYSAGSIIPDLNRVCDRGDNADCAEVTFAIHTANYTGSYDPSNDYSFVPSTSVGNNGNITVYQDGTLIWGTAP
jgi:hypothetical protein